MNFPYLIPRVIRHFLSEKIVRTLLLQGVIIRPGLETSDPAAAVERYVDVLAERGLSMQGKRVLVFGYGGRFDIGYSLLQRGAAYVVLCDRYASPDESHNFALFSGEGKYFVEENGRMRPRPKWMTLLQTDVREVQSHGNLEPVDFVLSSSVYEHLDDVPGITRALSALTKPDGMQIHFVDLRDHFFKYPFEMLRFSENVWKTWLNPSSNHNRYRLWDYRREFRACFAHIEIEILTREDEAFRRLWPHIRPEFISGKVDEDAAATIRVIASRPLIS